MHTGRVFGLGLSRTGTTSMHVASVLLGFSSIHYPLCFSGLAINWLQGNFSRQTTQLFNCYYDLPTPVYFRELDRSNPGSRFILTYRDEHSWLDSVETLYKKNVKLPKSPKTLWRNCISAACYGIIGFERQRFLDVYRRHNDSVADYFSNRRDALLTIDLASERDSWVALCNFLKVEAPKVPFPHFSEPDLGTLSWVTNEEIPAKTERIRSLLTGSHKWQVKP